MGNYKIFSFYTDIYIRNNVNDTEVISGEMELEELIWLLMQ